MKNIFTLFTCLMLSVIAHSQDTLSYWNFNASSAMPDLGTGVFTHIGGTSNAYFTGSTNDPASTNIAYSTNNYPTSGTNPKTAGVQIDVSTMGYENIQIAYDIRFSGTASNTWILQYTSDASTSVPVWTDVDTFTYTASSTWFVETYDFTGIVGINNNPNVAFRVVSNFNDVTGNYAPVSSSNYSTGGTARFDLVTIMGDQVIPYEIEFQENSMTVLENSGTINVIGEITDVGNTNADVDLVISALSNAGTGDYTQLTTNANIPSSKMVGDTVLFSFAIADDAIIESDEYFVCRFSGGNNITFDNDEQHTVYIRDNDGTVPQASNSLKLSLVTSFSNGSNASNSTEIIAYDSASQNLFIANSVGGRLDIISLATPDMPTWVDSIDITGYGNINSVAVKNGIVACAMENPINPQANGSVAFFNTNGVYQVALTVGALPDMCAFNHAGTKIYVANEGEPNDSYTVDPQGSISVIDISGGIASLTNSNVSTIDFTSLNGFENTLRNLGVRIYGPSANASQDLEPEYITISDDDTKAWVSLQENNAILELNLVSNTLGNIYGLGYKNHNLMQNSLDATNRTDSVNFATYPVFGMYQPDAIASYTDGTNMYVLSANEGDSRDYSGYSEEERVGDLSLDPSLFPNADELQNDHMLGRLTTTSALGDFDNDNDHDSIFSYGTRSFSIWNATSGFSQTFDSENQIEKITANDPRFANIFNSSNGSSPNFKNRSDDKGPEPEGIIVETINNTPYAFIGLERVGGVMVYDITNPAAPQYVTYENNRAQDQGTEGLIFIPYTQAADSNNYLILANETSSTITIYKVEEDCSSYQLSNATIGNDSTLVGTSSNSQKQDSNSSVGYYTPTCELIANISNASNLGNTTVSVFTDTSISVHNGQPFVARWFQITPTTNGAADVKLYFTQNDFDNYNAYAMANSWPLLPNDSMDMVGIANIRITKNDNIGLGSNASVLTPITNWINGENVWELQFTTPSFSQFRVHAANPSNTPLPVNALPLTGTVIGSTNQLFWTTLSEENNSHFVIQKSANGLDFENSQSVFTKAPNGTSTSKLDYSFTDETPEQGATYYRLQQVDIDGLKNYSNMVKLNQTGNQTVAVYPNPVHNSLNISVNLSKKDHIHIGLYDLSGRLILSREKIMDENSEALELNTEGLATGVYQLKVRNAYNVLHVQKIVKQ